MNDKEKSPRDGEVLVPWGPFRNTQLGGIARDIPVVPGVEEPKTSRDTQKDPEIKDPKEKG